MFLCGSAAVTFIFVVILLFETGVCCTAANTGIRGELPNKGLIGPIIGEVTKLLVGFCGLCVVPPPPLIVSIRSFCSVKTFTASLTKIGLNKPYRSFRAELLERRFLEFFRIGCSLFESEIGDSLIGFTLIFGGSGGGTCGRFGVFVSLSGIITLLNFAPVVIRSLRNAGKAGQSSFSDIKSRT
uniref:Uncharacterized protein n=1 Tax=Glossina brevipalpis TaxID=37001 RepID=A0A1A9WX25_9MUSC